MMSPSGNASPQDPAWNVEERISKSEADLGTATREFAVVVKPNYDSVCYHAQQCAEKILKALIVRRGSLPPKTHDLNRLMELVRQGDNKLDFDARVLAELTSVAVDVRYPGFGAGREDAAKALEAAKELWDRIRPIL
ncbi:MAG: HEPN domain-containing protein [Phycisphaerales bacterium]